MLFLFSTWMEIKDNRFIRLEIELTLIIHGLIWFRPVGLSQSRNFWQRSTALLISYGDNDVDVKSERSKWVTLIIRTTEANKAGKNRLCDVPLDGHEENRASVIFGEENRTGFYEILKFREDVVCSTLNICIVAESTMIVVNQISKLVVLLKLKIICRNHHNYFLKSNYFTHLVVVFC